MPDKKVATQASDGPWERETIITFNDAEKKASYYTCNKARMEQLKELAKEYPDAVKITRDEDWCMEADMPKKWVKIKPPRKLTEEQYAELVRRGKELAERQRQLNHGIPQDGYSYSQLKTKYEEKKAEQQNNPSTVQYQAPETPKEPSQNVQYQTPNAPAEVKTQPTQQNQNQDNG